MASENSVRPRPRIAIVGGGIAGLAAAHRIVELQPSCDLALIESADRLGGVLSTLHADGFQVERSADNFITTLPWGLDLCRRLGLSDQLLQTDARFRQTFVVYRGRLHKLPDGFLMMAPTRIWPLALTPLLSPWGKIRAAMEYFIPPRRDPSDESMAHFVRRRMGREAFERLVEPLVSAVYAADMERLSVLATLPRFREMEREHGSLIRAMRRQRRAGRETQRESGARYSMFVTLRDGLTAIVDAIAARLPPDAVRLRSPVAAVAPSAEGRGWQLSWAPAAAEAGGESSLRTERFDAVIIAAPSGTAARLVRSFDPPLADELAGIEHSGTAIVSCGFDESQIGHPIDGMGAVVPAVENSPLLAMSFSSRKYAHRAPPGKVLIRAFVGGARRPELAEADPGELTRLVLDSIRPLLRITGSPCFVDVARWPGTMPQYHVGHRQRVERIESHVRRHAGLFLAGNAYRGVGLPDCIHGGETAAEAALSAVGLEIPQ